MSQMLFVMKEWSKLYYIVPKGGHGWSKCPTASQRRQRNESVTRACRCHKPITCNDGHRGSCGCLVAVMMMGQNRKRGTHCLKA